MPALAQVTPNKDRARVISKPLLFRMIHSHFLRRPMSPQGFEAVSTRIWPHRRDRISYLWVFLYGQAGGVAAASLAAATLLAEV